MLLNLLIQLVENGKVPDSLTRFGMRQFIRQRLREEKQADPEAQQNKLQTFVNHLKHDPIAVHMEAANEQHYEVPASFFLKALGHRLKYSCCYFPENIHTLDQAEDAMLALTCQRAELKEGLDILELGCGWGSLSLWMAEHYPGSRITAVSNSNSQREFIMGRAHDRNLSNLEVITCDMNDFQTDRSFDRVVSVEMFEHMRNYEMLLQRISSWMRSEAKLFVHIFTHHRYAYPFETEGDDNWMGRYFFTGGIMPSDDLLLYFQNDVTLEKHWAMSGIHYHKTAEAWLQNMDAHQATLLEVMANTYGQQNALVWFNRWRMFFMAVSEVWGFRSGEEWLVSHYLFKKR